MRAKRTTVKDIATRMGISLSTVNKALTGKPGVSEKRRAEIIAVAKEMNYQVNHVAQSLSRKSIKIGIVIPSIWKQYFGLIEHGILMEFEKLAQENVQGFFRYIQGSNDIKAAFEFFYEMQVDIIVYCPSMIHIPNDAIEYLERTKIPVFTVGDECDEIDSVCSVLINAELSGYMAADFLKLFLSDGEQVAAFIGSGDMRIHGDKAEAFAARTKDNGLTIVGIYETFDKREIAKECIDKMFDAFPNVKGIYVATAIAAEITDFFSERPNIHIVATDIYDDIRNEMANGSIAATIFQNQVLIGRLAIKMAYRYLVEKTSYNAFEEKFSKKIYVNPHLFLPSNIESLVYDSGNDYMLA